jgi:hypothetical protein
MSRRRTPPVPLVAALVLAIGAVGSPARAGGADTWTFPGTCPGTTFQDCVDGAAAGDTIEIATNDPVQEVVVIDHSLTVRPAAGFHPTVLAMAAGDGSTGTLGVFLEDLRIPFGVLVRLVAGSGHVVGLHHLTMNLSPMASQGIEFDLAVPSSVEVTNTTVRGSLRQTDLVSVFTGSPSGLVSFRAVGNRLFGSDDPRAGGGFMLETSKAGSVRADYFNNSVWNVAACCGAEAGVAVHAQGPSHVDVNVVGNTIDRSGFIGLNVRNDLAPTGRISIDAFDDVFSSNRGPAIEIDSMHKPTLTFREGRSDFFANDDPNILEGHHLGPGNLAVNPRYAQPGTGGLALKASSPLIDAGEVCSPGGVGSPDAAGHTRLAGPSVDVGAFERDAGTPTGIAVVGSGGPDVLDGTPGADIVCGLGGADDLSGLAGRDYLDGGGGADLIIGGTGPDRLFGGPGDDPCLLSRDGVRGNDRVDGGPGNDGVLADPGDVRIRVEHQTPCN